MADQIYQGYTDNSGNGCIRETINGNGAIFAFGNLEAGYNGIDVKFLGTSADNYMLWDESANQFQIVNMPSAFDGTALVVYSECIGTAAGMRNGAVNISTYRDVAWLSNDGNPDCALKMSAQNRSVSGTYSGVRGLDINARNRTGSCGTVNGAYITAENYNGAAGVVNVTGAEIHSKNNAVATGNVKALIVMDESGSSTGTHYGIELTTGDGAFMKLYGIHINSAGVSGSGWTNAISFNDAITNVFDFENSDGTNGATLKSGTYSGSGNTIIIRCRVAGTPYYLIGHATAS